MQHILTTPNNFVTIYLQQHSHFNATDIIKLNLKFEAMQTLDMEEWLDDEVINFYHEVCLAKCDEMMHAHDSTCRLSLFFSTHFINYLFHE